MLNKKETYGSEKCESEYDEDQDYNARNTKATEEGLKHSVWLKPVKDDVKLIDFGGAT